MKHYSDTTFRARYPLSRKKLFKKMIAGIWAYLLTVFFIVFTILFALVEIYNSDEKLKPVISRYWYVTMVPLACFFLLSLILNYLYQKRYIETYYYNMTDKLIIIRKGVFAPQEITVPIERIQDVYLDQDFFDQLLGIYDVHISTATATSTVRAHIDGVDKRVAEELRELILNKLHQASRK